MLMHVMRLVPMDPERRGRLLHYLGDVTQRGHLRPRTDRGDPGNAGRHRLRDRGAALAGGVRGVRGHRGLHSGGRDRASCWCRP